MARDKTAKPTTSRHPLELTAKELRKLCDPDTLKFETTDELPDLQAVIGQPRAFRALELGSEVSGPGFNTFVIGLPGSGRTTLSREYLERKAAGEPVPADWCYVNNFDNAYRPKALSLPAGWCVQLRNDMEDLVGYCEGDISRVFESEEYVRERDRVLDELKKNQEAEFIRLQRYVEKYNFVIGRAPFGFVIAPAVEGKPLSKEDVEKLTPEQRTKLDQLQARLSEEVEKTLVKLREMERTTSDELSDLNERTVLFVIDPRIQILKDKYADFEKVSAYLDAVAKDIVEHADQFQPSQTEGASATVQQLIESSWKRRYAVKVLVDNSDLKGAPVIQENHPSYPNLLGRIEHEAIMGATRTDFTMIQAGAMHRANGGYLLLPARDLLVNSYTWEGLKRVLRDGDIRIIELGQLLGLLSTVTLEPEPIPLNIKVVLVGTPVLYYLLRTYDEDFAKLFKVRAEYATTMDRGADTENEYGLYIKSVVDDNLLPAFERTAVARVIEFSARMAENQNKLTTRFGKISDLVREAAYWAKKSSGDKKDLVVRAEDVQKAIDESIYRNNLIEERIQEAINEGTLMIDVSGEAIGQVNALSVYALGDYDFGRPSRVTCAVYPGKGGVVDIERQAKLGGPIHTKGVLILSGFLGSRYGGKYPLSLSASLTFEQSYEGVEGDSASTAELLALLSAIAKIPLRQDRALTGSVNQLGKVQPVGGVNEKIEGFYNTCVAKGLTGEQGVIIPAGNVFNLMLNDAVARSVEERKFHIWSIQNIDEGIELLTGYPAGELQEDGLYPEKTFNHAVMQRLADLAQFAKEAGQKPDEGALISQYNPSEE